MPQWFRCRNSSVTVQESDGFGLPHTQKVFRGRLRTRVSCGSLLASTNCDGLIPKLQSAPRSRGTFCTVSFLRLSLGCHRLSWQRQSGQSSNVMATSVWAVIGCHGNVSLGSHRLSWQRQSAARVCCQSSSGSGVQVRIS